RPHSNAPPPTVIYPLSLHDALPIYRRAQLRALAAPIGQAVGRETQRFAALRRLRIVEPDALDEELACGAARIRDHHVEKGPLLGDRKSTRLNSSHVSISYAVFCLKK